MFDVLTYQKGGALLRMLEQYLGAERFRDGVSHYLRSHAYGNTETGDLWDAIEHTSGEPVRRIMDSWIWQPGYPLVEARADGDELVLTQRRFAFDPEDASTSRWAIPIAVRQGGTTSTVLLDGDEIRRPLGEGPAVVNAGGHGFFRVSYSDELRARLTASTVEDMTTLERYNLVDDAWSAVTAQTLDASEYLELVERFGAEREYGVWQAIAIGLRGLRRLVIGDDAALEAFEQRVTTLCKPVLADLGEPTPDEPDLTAKLRGLLLAVVAVTGGDADARADARRYYGTWATDSDAVDAELAAAATAVVAATGDDDDYDRMLDQYRHGATPQVQLRHLYLLAEFEGERAHDAHAGTRDERRGQVPERAVPPPGRDRKPAPRSRRLGVRAAQLGSGQRHVPAEHDLPNRRDGQDSRPTRRRRAGAGLLRRAPDRTGGQDAATDPRAAARQRRRSEPQRGGTPGFAAPMSSDTPDLDVLRQIEQRVLWLATRIIDHANRRAETPDRQ